MEKKEKIQSWIEEIEKHKSNCKKLAELYMTTSGGVIYLTTFLIFGVINRIIELLDGIQYAIQKENVNVGGALMRMMYETTYVLFYAIGPDSKLDDKRYERFMKDGFLTKDIGNGKFPKVQEKEMVEHIEKYVPELEGVYKETSKFIHLSDKHLFNHIVDTKHKENNVLEFNAKIGVGNEVWYNSGEMKQYINLLNCIMNTIYGLFVEEIKDDSVE